MAKEPKKREIKTPSFGLAISTVLILFLLIILGTKEIGRAHV